MIDFDMFGISLPLKAQILPRKPRVKWSLPSQNCDVLQKKEKDYKQYNHSSLCGL